MTADKSAVEALADEWKEIFERWGINLYHVHANRLRYAIEKDKAAGWMRTKPFVGELAGQNMRLKAELADMRASEQRADNDTLDVEALARELRNGADFFCARGCERRKAQRYADILTGKAE